MDVIHIENVDVWFEAKPVLQNVSWRVARGEHWAVLGPNGSGKTTLLNLINGYVWPYGGRGAVTVLGQRLGSCNLLELRRQIGWVSPVLHDRMFRDLPGLDIVLSGRFAALGLWGFRHAVTGELRDRAQAILDSFGSGHLANRIYSTLSRGEQQQILLARVLMADPQLLLLDEPCAGLDFVAREQLLNAVGRMMEQAGAPTVIYVTHHTEEILPQIDRVLLLSQGRAVAQGDKADVLAASVLQDAFGVSLEVNWLRGRPAVWVHG